MSPQPKNEPAIAPAPSSSSADPPPFNCHPSLPQEILDSWRDFNPEWLKDPILMPDEVPDDWIDVEPLEWPPGLFDDAKDSGAAAKADGGEKTEVPKGESRKPEASPAAEEDQKKQATTSGGAEGHEEGGGGEGAKGGGGERTAGGAVA
ncbi:hypothetical protein NBRC10513v2_002150 [Rhodotorula toruloides]